MVGEPFGGLLEEVVGRGFGRWLRMNKKIDQNNPDFPKAIVMLSGRTAVRGRPYRGTVSCHASHKLFLSPRAFKVLTNTFPNPMSDGGPFAPGAPLITAAAAGDLARTAALTRGGGHVVGPVVVDAPAASGGWTALTAAVRGGHRAVAAYLVDTAGATVDCPNRDSGATALACAAFNGHRVIVADLLARGADARDGADPATPWTPLWFAAAGGHVNVVAALLRHGATAGARQGHAPLTVAADRGHGAVVAYLWTQCGRACRGDGAAALRSAAASGHVDVVQYLMDHGVHAGRPTPRAGITALHLAAGHGHAAVVRLLLDRLGPRAVAVTDRAGHTPFAWACEQGHAGAVRAFLRVDATPAAAVAAAAARRPRRAVAAALRDALAPWSPRVHGVRPRAFRATVAPTVLLALRARGLPRDLVVAHVVPCCGRDWWRPAPEAPAEVKEDAPGGVGALNAQRPATSAATTACACS